MVGQYIFVGRNTGVLPKGTHLNRVYDGRCNYQPATKEMLMQTLDGQEVWVKTGQLRRSKSEMFTARMPGF